MQIARYFAMSVKQTPDGEFVAGKSDEAFSALSAVRKARSLARQNDGAVALCRVAVGGAVAMLSIFKNGQRRRRGRSASGSI